MAKTMKRFHKFIQLTKVDEAKKQAWGIMAEQVADKSGEVFDYETSKPYVKAWSDSFAKATAATGVEKSYGNLRLQHTSTPIGKLIDIEFRDAEKQVYIGAEFSDDAAWALVVKGVLTGFSIGGYYVDTWKVDKVTHYTADLAEVSAVDNPCGKTSYFDAVKADGTSEQRMFVKSSNPLVQKVLFEFVTGTLNKGLYTVSDLAYVLSYLNSVRLSVKYEEEYEGDGSDIGGRLLAAVNSLSEVLQDYLAEETGELTADADEQIELSLEADGIQKAVTAFLAQPEIAQQGETEMTKEELGAALKEALAPITKQVAAIAEGQTVLATAIDEVAKEAKGTDSVVASLATSVSKLSAAPAAKGSLTLAVHKHADTGSPATGTTGTEEKGPAAKALEAALAKANDGIATPDIQAKGAAASLEAIRKIHSDSGIVLRPGENRFLAAR